MTVVSARPSTGVLPVDAVHVVDGEERIVRFDRVERWLHAVNGVLFLVVLATAAVLYVGPLSALVGRRELVKTTHVVAGFALFVPLVAAYAGPWSAGLRRDTRRLGRWIPDDWRWLRSRGGDRRIRLGKFNAGQKLNATLTLAAVPISAATGSIMLWFGPFPLSWRTGATFMHDWLALVLFVAVTGHILKALAEPAALHSIWSGSVPAAWAAKHRPRWHAEVTTKR